MGAVSAAADAWCSLLLLLMPTGYVEDCTDASVATPCPGNPSSGKSTWRPRNHGEERRTQAYSGMRIRDGNKTQDRKRHTMDARDRTQRVERTKETKENNTRQTQNTCQMFEATKKTQKGPQETETHSDNKGRRGGGHAAPAANS